jgi:glycosyltransferase involved in cell wall biosynthesis
MVSKALVVGAYQRKLEEIASLGVELTCVVPPVWRQDGHGLRLERAYTHGYELVVEPVRFNGRFHWFYFPGLGRQIAQRQPDIVHVDEEPYNLATYLATRQALQAGAQPLFFTWQNLYRRYPPPFRWMERWVLQRARYAIAGNAEAVRVLRRKGYRGPTAVIPQFGVDPEVFNPGQPSRCRERPFTIGYLGRLVEEKGLLVLLEALADLPGEWRLELYGHGPLEPVLRRVATSQGLSERVAIHAPVASTAVPERLRALDVLVLASLSRPNWTEQFGRVLVEAMACGVPVVGSESGEIPNVIGEAGLRFPEGDATALRDCLGRLMYDERLRAELAARGRVRVLERFTHEQVAAATVRVYREMLEAPASQEAMPPGA